MKFCPECNNLLHPRELRAYDLAQNPQLAAGVDDAASARRLIYACRRCKHTELADSPVVYRDDIAHSSAEKTQVLVDVATDPTLPRTQRRCPKCGNGEAVFYQAQNWTQDAGVMLFFVCTNPVCGNRWTDQDS